MEITFDEGKYFFRGEQKEKGGIYSESENIFLQGRRLTEEKEGNIWRGKICFFAVEMNNREGKEGSFARCWSIKMIICNSLFNPDNHLQKASPSR